MLCGSGQPKYRVVCELGSEKALSVSTAPGGSNTSPTRIVTAIVAVWFSSSATLTSTE